MTAVDVFGTTTTVTTTVTKTAPPVNSVTVSLAQSAIVVGASTQATATLFDTNGAIIAPTGRTITWTSSNPSVATVSATGLVTAVAVGTATITATSEGRSGGSTLTMSP